MALSREAQLLLEFLEQHPGALAELVLSEQAAPAGKETPALDAIRVLRPWSRPLPSRLQRLELVHGMLVGLVETRPSLPGRYGRSELGPRSTAPWVGYAFRLGPNALEPRIELGGADSPEACCALVDAVLSGTTPRYELPRWRLL
jgi:hypothetical protein